MFPDTTVPMTLVLLAGDDHGRQDTDMLMRGEVCQVAIHRVMQNGQGHRRLYAGRPWLRVAIDVLVGHMPLSKEPVVTGTD